ncbi:hypothetical protein Q3V37_17925 [Micromonospora profundi]|uniref:Uncharacterized protein n=1 Tax=Micromonospora profundi TaxID=1420889 RepID=A0AAJ6HLZ2_9ACTN|nr:hypothetical protein [Micromonospora profundi]WLS43295.1 hypothetical protein Q3V37_17925 [Micromonospora profundi]
MDLYPTRVPPPLAEELSWRQLWRSGAFAQLDLTWDTNFSARAKERGLGLGIGQRQLERLDMQGALQPIAFAEGGSPHRFVDVSPFETRMTFREEEPARAWPTYARDSPGRQPTSALYSPWQLLYVEDVLRGKSAKIGLEILLAPAEERDAALERTRECLEAQQDRWQTLDAAWRPLVKLLVRLQNRYLPECTGRTTLLYDAKQKQQVDPWPAERERFDARTVAAELAVSAPQVTEAYWFLVERGIDYEPRDSLELLRRARPRSSHKRLRGMPRQARDHFDAAQLLWFFLTDLTGDPPGRPPLWPMDGRQPERAALYDKGPAAQTTRAQLQEELVQAGLYPHAVHVVGEGQSEREMVWRLVAGLLGRRWADELGFTDLGGAGSASRLNTMVTGFTTYAQRTVIIVDSEGAMAQYVTGLIRSGQLPADDVLNFEANLEDSNFTPAEMLDVLIERAANPSDGRPAVNLALPLDDVLAAHEERGRKPREKPGLAGILLKLAEDPNYGGPFIISKPDFATALAERILLELNDTRDDEQKLEALRARRPLLRFVLDRMLPVLTGPRWR